MQGIHRNLSYDSLIQLKVVHNFLRCILMLPFLIKSVISYEWLSISTNCNVPHYITTFICPLWPAPFLDPLIIINMSTIV
jgi:hypothetical protein